MHSFLGENSIVVVPGANDLLSVDQVIHSADLIKNATVLLCQFESPLDATLQALRIHKGHGSCYDIISLKFYIAILLTRETNN